VSFADPLLAIPWPIDPDPAVISEKDLSHPPLAD
jgi:dTDP-4-dehydrorhamnose 3,5-epimerase-like enzyme